MITAYIGIGSNMGESQENCLTAVEKMKQVSSSRVTGVSEWYLTRPVGLEDQNWFVNGVASLDTNLSVHELLTSLLNIETEMGRVREERWGPRVIDLDILLYGNEIIDDPDLRVPHPRMQERKFVLIPLNEMAPNLIHPEIGKDISKILGEFEDLSQTVTKI